ncbi:MAG: DsbA family protein [Legionellaceae bacterium]|nr:DsbA family protein [Legionellaceae bacterium]
MKVKTIVVGMALSAILAAPAAMAAEAISPAQKKEIEQIIHDYLVSNPEVLMEASQALQQKQQQKMQAQSQEAIIKNASALFADSKTSIGNPKGNVTIVEFFDYQCIHCKKMAPVMSELVAANKDLRVIYVEFPIFGKSSETASRAALAAAKQGKYKAFHDVLIEQDGKLNEESIMAAAQSVDLDMAKLKKDMQSDAVSQVLQDNRKLAEAMHLMGTPAFVVAATPNGQFKATPEPAFIPGAASKETLKDLIKKASNNS